MPRQRRDSTKMQFGGDDARTQSHGGRRTYQKPVIRRSTIVRCVRGPAGSVEDTVSPGPGLP